MNEMDYVSLSAIASAAIGTVVFAYIKLLKKKLKRHVLRYHLISKYFEQGE